MIWLYGVSMALVVVSGGLRIRTLVVQYRHQLRLYRLYVSPAKPKEEKG